MTVGRAAVFGRGAPLFLALPAVGAVSAVLLPLVYLAVRAGLPGSEAWELVEPGPTAELVASTALLVAAVVLATVVIGVPLAWLVVRSDLPGRRMWAVAAALPLVVPSYVSALALLGALGPRGLLQDALEEPFGVERLPEIYGFAGALLALTVSTYPKVFLLTAAGLRGLDSSLEEAARSLGSSPLGAFVRVTLPGVRPSVAAGALLVALYALSDFGAVSLMQYDALTRSVYLRYQALFDRSSAAALALVLVALTAVVVVAEAWARRAGTARTSPRAGRRPAPVRLGRWRWPALGFCTLVVGSFLIVPLGVLTYWTARGLELGKPLELPWREAANSLLVSAAAAATAVVAVVPVAVLAHRFPALWTRALERLAYLSNALPGIVVALALVFFGARYGGVLYQTLAILIFAYVVRFLPQALAAVSAGLGAVSPRVEEAGRTLGRGRARVLLSVTLPLAAPGALTGAALVFLSAMKELPATLLLRPIGFDTLAVEIWTATSVDAYSHAAPAALLLVLVAAPFVYALAARRQWERMTPG